MTETDSAEISPKPDAQIEPSEPNPGGPDALPRDDNDVVPADLPIDRNPAVDDATTPSLAEGEDTSTKATEDEEPDDAEEAPA